MSNFIKSFRSWLQQGNHATWLLFALFSFILLVKTIIFHWTCFHSILLSSLWHHPGEFFRFWGGKICPVLFVSSFVFITRKPLWAIIVSFLSDIWMIANIFYYKANTLFLSVETMKMADNMSGFWSSLLSYMDWSMLWLIITTIIFAILVYIGNVTRKHRNYLLFSIIIAFSLLMACGVNYLYGKSVDAWGPQNSATAQVKSRMTPGEDFHYYFPLGNVYYWAKIETCTDYDAWSKFFVKDYSILSYFPSCFVYGILAPAGEIIQLTEPQLEDISKLIAPISNNIAFPNTNLIFILFESMESWPLEEVCGYQYMPYLSSLIHSEHVLYCDKLTSQVRHGNSADGQMIAVTGMLPISNGATCRLYGQDAFPNYAHFYERSAIINPAPGMWQQSIVTYNYGFTNLIEPTKDQHWDDNSLLKEVANYATKNDSSFCVLGITVTSHVPFAHGSEHPKYEIEGMPAIMSAYLNCLNYTDSCIATLMSSIIDSKLAENTTVVISGDHTIFRSEDAELDAFARQSGFNFKSGDTRTPLIVYSPLIEGNMCVTDECYQMDIFPTILHLIGCEDYYWHGLGVNLLDEEARQNRPIEEQEAYRLSDLMIRSNYFRKYLYK